jgi:chorismate-pyruvate lyase
VVEYLLIFETEVHLFLKGEEIKKKIIVAHLMRNMHLLWRKARVRSKGAVLLCIKEVQKMRSLKMIITSIKEFDRQEI